MKPENGLLRAIAVVLAVSVMLSGETAACDIVFASDYGAESFFVPQNADEIPESAETPDTSGFSEPSDNPESSETPEVPDTPGSSESSDRSESSETPEVPDTPGSSESSDNSESSETPEAPDTPDSSEPSAVPDQPEPSEIPDIPENSDGLETADVPDSVSANTLSAPEDLSALALAETDYGEAAESGMCGTEVVWTYYADTKTLVISGSGAMQDYGNAPWTVLDFENLVVEEGVTAIGDNAFRFCRGLTGTVRLPASLTEIGSSAFYYCDQIGEIQFAAGEGEDRRLTIGNTAFASCTSLERICFPENLRDLQAVYSGSGQAPYYNCPKLTSVTIPGSLGKITKDMGFQGMTALKRIEVEEGIESIEKDALPKEALEEIWLPDSLTAIPEGLFNGASHLAGINPDGEGSVNLPEGITAIGANAFRSCRGLAGTVRLPASLTEIGSSAFYYCDQIEEVRFAAGEGEDRTLSIGNVAFASCTSLERICFPENLRDLQAVYSGSGQAPYYNCPKLISVVIPGSLGKITKEMGFQGMTALKRIEVEEGIESIEKDALPKGALEEIWLPDSLTAIPEGLFNGASHLAGINPDGEGSVNLPEGITAIGDNAFRSCRGLTGTVRLPASLTEIGSGAFYYCDQIGEIQFAAGEGEDRRLTIGNTAFVSCKNLEHISFPENLRDLNAAYSDPYKNPYYNCPKLTSVTIPGSLGKITKDMGFQGMTALKRIKVEEGIESIEKDALPKGALEEIWLPDSLTAIPEGLFNGASHLAGINPDGEGSVNLPEGITAIGANAFRSCRELRGDLVIPDGVVAIGESAFYGSGFTGTLYLSDHLRRTDGSAFASCPGLTTVRTSLTPPLNSGGYYSSSIFYSDSIQTLWFRGTDDTDVVTVDGTDVSWSKFFTDNYRGLESADEIYIDVTVKRLTSQSFWEKYTDVTFVGPNVIAMDRTGGKNIFPAAPVPLKGLEGVYYVTEEGVLYALDPVSGTAALSYCPPGVTELYIPNYITAAEELTGEKNSRYARSYRVVGVTQHAVIAATDLIAVTAENPQQIILNVNAFADCPTLSSVNGVTTQKEANALFGPNGTPAVKRAFVNTGLSGQAEEPAGQGKPMRALTYTNPSVGKLTVNIRRSSTALADQYQDDAYRLLTGEGIAIDLKAEAYGTGNLVAPFRLYFEPSDPEIQGIQTGKMTYTFESNGKTYMTEVKTDYDRISGCYCVSFSLPAGVTWEWQGVADTGPETVMYPARTRGGSLSIWGEVQDYTGLDEEEDAAGDEVFGGFSGEENYMTVHWGTQRNLYRMSLSDIENKALIDNSSHKPRFEKSHGYLFTVLKLREGEAYNSNRDIGKDPVTGISYVYTVTLPEGLMWAEDRLGQNSSYPFPKAEKFSVSPDGRVLTYEFTQSIVDNYVGGTLMNLSLTRLDLGWSHLNNGSVIVLEDSEAGRGYDFYHDLGQRIQYKCIGTVFYQFSEPDQMPEVTAYEVLKPTDAGVVELKRKYAFPDGERGRGLPMEISFVAENKGKDPAFVNLEKITDEVVNDRGYLYLTPEQMADVILGESEFLEAEQIEITGVTLYRDIVYESGVTHRGTDYDSQVCVNLLNTYTEPVATGATLTLTVGWPESSSTDGEGDTESGAKAGTGGRRPTKLTLRVNNEPETSISFSGERDALAKSIADALQEAGYLVPTGLYKITWKATDAVAKREIGPYTDTEGQSYLWTIGSYRATVKPDYVQGHRWLTVDSLGRFSLFPETYNNMNPTARAVFTLKNESGSYTVTEVTRDRSYESSVLSTTVKSLDGKTGREVLLQENQQPWICPGVVLAYQVNYQNGNSIAFGDIPFQQTLDKNQCLLAPCVENPALADRGYEIFTFRERDYYMLKPAESAQEIGGVWLGTEEEMFYAASVSLAGSAGKGEEKETRVWWYEKSFGPYGKGDDKKAYRFYTCVLEPEIAEERPASRSTIYANNYKNDQYSTRLYTYSGFGYRNETIGKDIIINPEAVGTGQEKTSGEQRVSYLGVGTSVTYRLSFDEYWIGDYELKAGEIYDLLPCTYGAFAWELDRNVKVQYFQKVRTAGDGEESVYEAYAGESSAQITAVEEPAGGLGEKAGQYRLSFGDFTIPYNRTLYIYVTLLFPEDREVWDSFADAADVTIYNTFCYGDRKSSVGHMIARPSQAFLKTGMYGTDGDPYGYIYANSDERSPLNQYDRIVKYYVVIYNHGKSCLYLNPVHVKIPEGFALMNPPKFTGEWPNWNLSDVSVVDENPPADVRRREISDVKVTYPKEGEAALDIALRDSYSECYDGVVGKYFLRPGQYLVMEVRFTVDGYQCTPDQVELPAAMPVDDFYHVGRIEQVQGVDAHRSGYYNSNEGIPEFWESNEIAADRGFADPVYAGTGKWVASQVELTREEAKPGVEKGAPTQIKVAQNGSVTENPAYDPQQGVAMECPVKWETKLVNGGSNALTDYTVKDSVQWPYVFDGEVKLASQYNSALDQTFVIERYTQNVELDGDSVEQVDRGRLRIGETEVQIASDRETALAEGSGCYAEIMGGARVYFYKEDAFGDGNPAETMEIDFSYDRTYGIGPASYENGRVTEKERILSYWTKFDLSRRDEVSRTSYANRVIMRPARTEPYTRAEVCRGIAIDEAGGPVKNTEEPIDGIMALGYVSVNIGQSTAAWIKVKENKKPGEEQQGPEISDDLQEMLTRENKIIQGDVENTLTYTLNILNHVANPSDTVLNDQDRKYSIKDMVIINTLPHVGDKMPFNSRVPRSSDFEIRPDQGSFDISLYYYDADLDGKQETEVPEDRLKPIPADCYQVLYNQSESVASGDWKFNENSGAGWNAGIPDSLAAGGWKTSAEIEDISQVKSVRIEIKDPNTVFDSDNPSVYRSLMKAGRTIVVKYQARVATGTDGDGGQTPTPGQCAWNSFGYRFDRFDGGKPMEASSIRSGVQIPSIPILYEKLIDYDQNPFVNPKEPQEFVFTIDKQEGEREDGTKRPAQQLRFSVTVGTGKTENYRELRNIRDNAEITWWREEADDPAFFWEDGASYVVKQVTAPMDLPLFSIRINGQLITASTAGFTYDALYEPVIVVTNQSRYWSSRLYKMDRQSAGYDPADEEDRTKITFLEGALFGLYTTDRTQQVDIAQIKAEAGDRYVWRERYKALLYRMTEVTYGDDPDTAVKLYLKDFCVTDASGEIQWLNLEDDGYYVRELDPPQGFQLDETFYQIGRKRGDLSVYNDPGLRFPITGGVGVMPFYVSGGLLIANVVYMERRDRRRKRKKEKGGNQRKGGCGKAMGRTLTLALAVRIFIRVLEIRRERRKSRASQKK